MDKFDEMGLRQPGPTAIDVDALIRAVDQPKDSGNSTRQHLAAAVGGVLAAAVTLTDPPIVVLGGDWGITPDVVAAVQTQCSQLARPVQVRPATFSHDAALSGASDHAWQVLRREISQYRQPASAKSAASGPAA